VCVCVCVRACVRVNVKQSIVWISLTTLGSDEKIKLEPEQSGSQHQCAKKKQKKHPFNVPLSGTTQVSRYQKGKTNLDFTEARDSEWQWHQLGHMQVCT